MAAMTLATAAHRNRLTFPSATILHSCHARGRLNQTWCFPSMPRVSFYYPLNNAFPLSSWVLVRATETDICNQGTRFCPLGAESRSAFTFRRWYGYLFLRCVALILNYFLGNIRGPLSPLITRKNNLIVSPVLF